MTARCPVKWVTVTAAQVAELGIDPEYLDPKLLPPGSETKCPTCRKWVRIATSQGYGTHHSGDHTLVSVSWPLCSHWPPK